MPNPQIENLEKVAAVLSQIPEQFVFTGGATIALYLDEILWDEVRPTIDVDCVVEIASRAAYYTLADRLRALGLEECTEPDAPLCRWLYQDLIVDIMPCDAEILGFSNRWYQAGIQHKMSYILPSGQAIAIFSPIYLLASKVEAFLGRGQNFRFSKDIEDIVILLDGCEVLIEQFETAEKDVIDFLRSWFRENKEDLEEAILCFLPASSYEREDIVIELIQKFAA